MTGARRRYSESGGQAVLEMALVLPICILLVMNFLGIMIVVRLKTQATAATSLAAQASISGPVSDTHDACVYAGDTFFSTMFNQTPVSYTGCPVGVAKAASFNVTSNPPTGSVGFAPGAISLSCTEPPGPNYFDGLLYPPVPATSIGPPVTCSTTVPMSFANSPLAFAVFWTPTLTVTSKVYPSTVRQKCSDAACTIP